MIKNVLEKKTYCNRNVSTFRVVCEQLGFTGGEVIGCCGNHDPGTGRTWLDTVYCYSDAHWLTDCDSSGLGRTSCQHSRDVGVRCDAPQVHGWLTSKEFDIIMFFVPLRRTTSRRFQYSFSASKPHLFQSYYCYYCCCCCCCCCFSFFCLPKYYYWYIWRKEEEERSSST